MAHDSSAPKRHLRAALVLLHLVAISLMAFPAPEGGMTKSAWADPTVKAEFHAWGEVLRRTGLPWDDDTLIAHAWTFATAFSEGRRVVLWPFQPYYQFCGARQSWRMFVAPHRFPTKLFVEVHEDGEWRPVYVERDKAHAWLGHWLDHDRFRSEIFRFGWKQYGKSYAQFGAWLAGLARDDFPEADALRTRMWRAESPSPDQVLTDHEPEGAFESVRVYDLHRAEGKP